jgi:DNA-binding transcriptional ArsR family regulator
MLCCLMDNHARTATELAIIAQVSASTASAHLGRLKEERLVKVFHQGKHRYYSLAGPNVATVLDGLLVLSGRPPEKFAPDTPNRLCAARTCYDHIAGTLGVVLHDRMLELDCFRTATQGSSDSYELTKQGVNIFSDLGIDVQKLRTLRRRLASPCLDWSERRPHLGGGLAAALLTQAVARKWITRDLDSRALSVTPRGRRAMRDHLQVEL